MIKYWKRFTAWISSFYKKKAIAENQPIATRIIKPGVIVWECDLISGDVRKADVVVKRRIGKNREVTFSINENCIYEFSLNGTTAVKKFENRILKVAEKIK